MKVWFLGGPRHMQQHDVPVRRYDQLPAELPALAVVEETPAVEPHGLPNRTWEQVVYRLRWAADGSSAWDGVGLRKWPCYCADDFDGPIPAEVRRG